MDLKYENELIKFDAEYAMKVCEEKADSRSLQKDYVVSQFIKEFKKIAKKKEYID